MSITVPAPLFLLVCDLLSGDQEEVKLTGGAESVVLPCRTSPNLHEKTSVYWTRSEPEFNTVHVYSNQSKDQKKQDSLYRGRTKLNEDLLRTGDLSLTLSYPTERDSGTYICTLYRDEDILRWKVVLKHVRGQYRLEWWRLLKEWSLSSCPAVTIVNSLKSPYLNGPVVISFPTLSIYEEENTMI
uniref:Ig-like domain-containing protein n=1 Tax=Fundulus heteroclitus TaxID=8078 RepID=A0A3Q2NWM8_FUNHE